MFTHAEFRLRLLATDVGNIQTVGNSAIGKTLNRSFKVIFLNITIVLESTFGYH